MHTIAFLVREGKRRARVEQGTAITHNPGRGVREVSMGERGVLWGLSPSGICGTKFNLQEGNFRERRTWTPFVVSIYLTVLGWK